MGKKKQDNVITFSEIYRRQHFNRPVPEGGASETTSFEKVGGEVKRNRIFVSYSPYFYNLVEECQGFIVKREQNEPYAIGLPCEAIKQFSKETRTALRLLKSIDASKETHGILREANMVATLLLNKFATIAMKPFNYNCDIHEALFDGVTSLLMRLENVLTPVLVPSERNYSMRIR